MRTSPAASALFLLAALTALLTASTSAASMCDRKPAVQTSSLRVPCAVETHFPIFPFVAPPNTFYPNAYAIASVNGDAFPLDIVYTSTSNAPNYPVLFMASGGPPLFAAPLGIFLVTNLNNTRPTAMAVHDFTGNGQADVVIATEEPSLLFLANDGAGTFTPPGGAALDFGGLLYITDLIAADVDNDGNTDLLLSSATSNAIGWVPHSGGGVFGAYATLHTGAPFSQVELVDIVGNGAPLDIVASAYGTTLLYLPNTGGATFGTPVVIESTASISPRTFAVGDINGDGANDLFALTTPDDTAGFYFNDGSGSFSPRLLLDGGYSAVGNRLASLGDIDNSGTMDIAVTSTPDTVIIYWGLDGVSTFSVPKIVTFETGAAFSNVLLTDLYGNGVLDVVCLAQTSQTVGYIPNLQLVPQFLPVIPFATPSSSIDIAAVAAGDATGDNYPDLFVARGRFIFLYALDPSATAVLNIVKTVDASSSPSGIVTSLAIADLDADGDNDLVATDSIGNIVKVYININGVGDFSDPDLPAAVVAQAPAIAAPTDATLADVDGDGDIDIVVACDSLVGSVVWFANSGTLNPTWSGPHVVNASVDSAHSVRVGDFRRVGAADIVAAYSASILVAYNTAGDGSVWDTHLLTVAPGVRNVLEIGDINLDSTVDVVFLHSSGTLGWFANTGTSFAPTYTTIATYTSAAQHIRVIDTNSNYGLDVAVQIDATSLVVHPLVAAGVFGTPVNVVTGGTNVGAFDVADLEYDHGRDIDVFVRNGDHVGVSKYALHNAFKPVVPTTVTPYTLDFGHLRDSPRSACYRFSNNGGLNVRCILEQSLRGSACVSDTVQLMPGTYRHCAKDRHLRVNHRVVLTSPPGANVTIDCAADGGGVLFEAGITDDATTPIDAYGGLVLTNINITGTTVARAALFGSPGFRAVGKGSYIELINVHISNCAAVPIPDTPLIDDGGGGCVLARDGAEVILSGSTITSSAVGDDVSGGAAAATGTGSSICIDTSLIADNSASRNGGGIVVSAAATVSLLDGTRLLRNTASSGGAVAATTSSFVTIDGATLGSNVALGHGGAVSAFSDSRIVLTLGTIASNVAGQHGGGVWLESGAELNATAACTLVANVAASAGGALALASPAAATVTGSTFSANVGAFGGAAAVLDVPAVSAVVGVATLVDFPTSATPPPLNALPLSAALVLNSTLLASNTATRSGHAVLACGAGVHIDGAATAWSDGASVFVCLPPGGPASAHNSQFAPSTTTPGGVPWFSASPTGFAALGSIFDAATPPILLAVVDPLDTEVMPGVSLRGTVVASDWFGAGTSDARLRLRIELGNGGAAMSDMEVRGTPTVLVAVGGHSPVPPAEIRVADPSVLPVAGVELRIGLEDSTGHLAHSLSFSQTVDVALCGVGFGGVFDTEGFACATCADGTTSTAVSLDNCIPIPNCLVNTVVVANSRAPDCECNTGFTFSKRDANGLVMCVPCPDGGVCARGLDRPVPAAGYFPVGNNTFVVCKRPNGCPGRADRSCTPGYEGYMCNTCSTGYYSNSASGCVVCPSVAGGLFAVVLTAVAIGCMVAACAVGVGVRRAQGESRSGDPGDVRLETMRQRSVPASVGMVLVVFQVIGILADAKFSWSSNAKSVLSVFNVANIDTNLFASECTLSTFHAKYAIAVFLPLGIVATVAVALIGTKQLSQRGVSTPFGLDQLADTPVKVLFDAVLFAVAPVLYIPMVRTTVILLDCSWLPNGDVVLDINPGVACFDRNWFSVLPICLLGLFTYVLGIPAYFMWCLGKNQHQLLTTRTFAQYGSLYRLYRVSYYWGGVAELGKRLLLVLAAVFASDHQLLQIGLLLAIFLASAFVVTRLRPYYYPLYNAFDVRLTVVLIVLLLLGGASNSERNTAGASDTVIFAAVIVVLAVLLVVIIHGVATDVVQIFRARNDRYSSSRDRSVRLVAFLEKEKHDLEADAANHVDGLMVTLQDGLLSSSIPIQHNALAFDAVDVDDSEVHLGLGHDMTDDDGVALGPL